MAIKASPARAPGEKHTAIYLRVSTTGQDHASQLPELERWAAAHDGQVVWYRDKFTGKTMERPGMSRLLRAVQSGQVQRIVVWRLDRLGRTARGLCELFEELTARKVDLVSIRDGFNLASASGRLHARILASVAEFETEVRAERVRAGQAAARARGVRWGGSEKGRYVKVRPEQEKEILRKARAGEPITHIASITGLSRPTIYRVLENHGAKGV
jgi:DNA invertase Pin-like site-specific DNA recombinase